MGHEIANHVTETKGLVMKYHRPTDYWVAVDENGAPVEDFPYGADLSADPEYLSHL